MEKIKNVTSNLVTIRDIIDSDKLYNVPRYQRLYVWKKQQVNTLLFDLYNAFETRKTYYHLGSVLLVQPDDKVAVFDLVDGQQRFTTLWLLGLELGGEMSGFIKNKTGSIMLNFAIRQDVKEYFENLICGKEIDADETKEAGSLGRIKDARMEIRTFLHEKFNNNNEKKELFINFLCNKVQLIQTHLPRESDLSKIFEVINNRGVQLQHADILKSLLFSKITKPTERIQYSKIWNACSNMDTYIERAFALELSEKNISDCYNRWEDKFDWASVINKCKNANGDEPKSKSLTQILKTGKIREIEQNEIDFHPDAKDDEFQKVRSILTFPQLLLHTLRIYLLPNQTDITKLNEKELLQIFKEHFKDPTEKDVKKFIKLLWTVREAFDRHVIKWVEVEPKKEVLMLKKIECRNNTYKGRTWYLQRTIDSGKRGLEMLQSLLYHSQENATQYWLTPYLYKIINDGGNSYDYLKKLDNYLFNQNENESTLIKRTRKIMESGFTSFLIDQSILDEKLGTGFSAYLFYKLEFVLWHELSALPEYNAWKDYRINARNSKEHISPQSEEFQEDTVSNDLLHSFGNMALVSRGLNSEFSNKPFREKKERFLYKRKAGDIESLKLDLVYENENWGDEKCIKHFDFLKKILNQYFEKTEY